MRIKNILMLLGAVALSLIALEFAARAIGPAHLTDSWMMVDDQGLVLNRPGSVATHHRGNTSATYRINTLNMRGDMPAADIPSILVVGDSFTFGWLVDNHETLVSQLQKQADRALGKNKLVFLNAGTGGWGTASYLDYLTRYTESLQPSAVLIFANATDFNRSLQSGLFEISSDAKKVVRTVSERPMHVVAKKIITDNELYRWLIGRSYLLNMLKQALLATGSSDDDQVTAGAEMLVSDKINPPAANAQAYNAALFKHLKSVLDDRSVPVYVSSQYHWQYTDDAYDWLVPLLQNLGIPFLSVQRDLATATKGEVEGFFIDGDPHPTGATYVLLAQKTWDWLLPKLKVQEIGR